MGSTNKQQRYSLTRETANDGRQEVLHESVFRSTPTSPLTDVATLKAIEALVPALLVDGDEVTPSDAEDKPKRAKGVRFDAPSPPPAPSTQPEPVPRPSRGKAKAYAQRLLQMNIKLQQNRQTLSSLRTKLAIQDSMVKSKQDFVEETLDLLVEMVLSASTPADVLSTTRDTLHADRAHHQEEHARLAELKEDISKCLAVVQHLELRFDHVLSRFLSNAVDDADDDFSQISEESQGSRQVSKPVPTAPIEVERFLDKFGDHRILTEQLQELEAEWNEEIDRREILSEQEKPVSDGFARQTDAEFSAQREHLRDALQRADDDVVKAYEECIRKGYPDPERYMTDVRFRDPDEHSSVSQDPAGGSSGVDYAPTDPTTYNFEVDAVFPIPKGHLTKDEADLTPSPVDESTQAAASPVGSEKVAQWLEDQLQQADGSPGRADLSEVDVSTDQEAEVNLPDALHDGYTAAVDALEEERQRNAAQAALEDIYAGLTSRMACCWTKSIFMVTITVLYLVSGCLVGRRAGQVMH